MSTFALSKPARPDFQVKSRIDDYENIYQTGTNEDRNSNYMKQVNTYYDLVTPFYEYAWGQSFHFAPQYDGEDYMHAITRYEHGIALSIKAHKSMRILDVGCGIGGPMRTIARLSGAHIVGVNNNSYQINRAIKLSKDAGLDHLLSFVECDFHNLSSKFEPNSFDAVYSIEAIVHSPNKLQIYQAIYNLMKPGARFVSGEWVVTEKYNPNIEAHRHSIDLIEKGDALPSLETTEAIVGYVKQAGFVDVEAEDISRNSSPKTPWYHPLLFSLSMQGILRSTLGRYFTHFVLSSMEWVGLATVGVSDVSRILMEAADGLVTGGKLGIFTPLLIVSAQKPSEPQQETA